MSTASGVRRSWLEAVRGAAENIVGANQLDDAEHREILADAGTDGAEAVSAMPSDHIDLLSMVNASPQLKARYIRNYNELGRDVQDRMRRLVETEPGALRFAGEVVRDALDRLLQNEFSDAEIGRILDGMSGRTFSELADTTDAFSSLSRGDSHLVLTGERYGSTVEIDSELSRCLPQTLPE